MARPEGNGQPGSTIRIEVEGRRGVATPREKRGMAPTPPIQRPTRRQLEVLCAYIAAGSIAAAAYELGISETTPRQHLSGLYRRTGCLNAAQAAYLLGTRQLDSDATIVTG